MEFMLECNDDNALTEEIQRIIDHKNEDLTEVFAATATFTNTENKEEMGYVITDDQLPLLLAKMNDSPIVNILRAIPNLAELCKQETTRIQNTGNVLSKGTYDTNNNDTNAKNAAAKAAGGNDGSTGNVPSAGPESSGDSHKRPRVAFESFDTEFVKRMFGFVEGKNDFSGKLLDMFETQRQDFESKLSRKKAKIQHLKITQASPAASGMPATPNVASETATIALDAMAQENLRLKGELDTCQKDRDAKAAQLSDTEQTLAGVREDLKMCQIERDAKAAQLAETEQTLSGIPKDHIECQKDRDAKAAKLTETEQALAKERKKFDENMGIFLRRFSEVRSLERQLLSANEALESCKNERDAFKNESSELKNERDANAAQISEKENALASMRMDLNKCQKELADIRIARAARGDRVLAETRRDLKACQNNLAVVSVQRDGLQVDLAAAMADAEKLKSESDKIRADLAAAKAEAERLKTESDKIRAALQEFQKARDAYKANSQKIQAEFDKIEKGLKQCQNDAGITIARLEREIETCKTAKKNETEALKAELQKCQNDANDAIARLYEENRELQNAKESGECSNESCKKRLEDKTEDYKMCVIERNSNQVRLNKAAESLNAKTAENQKLINKLTDAEACQAKSERTIMGLRGKLYLFKMEIDDVKAELQNCKNDLDAKTTESLENYEKLRESGYRLKTCDTELKAANEKLEKYEKANEKNAGMQQLLVAPSAAPTKRDRKGKAPKQHKCTSAVPAVVTVRTTATTNTTYALVAQGSDAKASEKEAGRAAEKVAEVVKQSDGAEGAADMTDTACVVYKPLEDPMITESVAAIFNHNTSDVEASDDDDIPILSKRGCAVKPLKTVR